MTAKSHIRMRITIEYDGSDLVGWQRQDNGPSVQQYLEEAALRLTGQDTLVQGSGRTDAGVHATGQVAHLDVPDHLDSKAVMMGLNSWLETPAMSPLIFMLVLMRWNGVISIAFTATVRALP